MALRLARLGSMGVALALASCAAIWGFQDARDREDTGLEPSLTPGVVCVPAPPAEGWQGPLAIFEGPNATPLPACGDAFSLAFDVSSGPNAAPGTCTCTCKADGTFPCAEPVMNLFTEGTCTTPCGKPDQVVPPKSGATCEAVLDKTGCPMNTFGKIVDAKPAGQCTPVVTDPPAPLAWSTVARLCEAKPGTIATCPAGKIAAPAPRLPFNPGNLCIATQSSTLPCPPDYPKERTYFDPKTVSDTRACNACTCGAPHGTCGGEVITSDRTDCTGGNKDTMVPATACTANVVKGDTNTAMEYVPPAGGATAVGCDPSGGGPSGAFSTGSPLKVCCRL